MAKFAKVKVRSTYASSSLQFSVEVAAMLTNALANLPTIEWSSKLEIVVIFSYNIQGENLYVWLLVVISLNPRILRKDDSQEEDIYYPPRRVLLAPIIFIRDSAESINIQAFATNSQTRVWSTHCTMYLPSTERSFRKLVMDPKPVVHLIHCYSTAVD